MAICGSAFRPGGGPQEAITPPQESPLSARSRPRTLGPPSCLRLPASGTVMLSQQPGGHRTHTAPPRPLLEASRSMSPAPSPHPSPGLLPWGADGNTWEGHGLPGPLGPKPALRADAEPPCPKAPEEPPVLARGGSSASPKSQGPRASLTKRRAAGSWAGQRLAGGLTQKPHHQNPV